MEGHFLEPKRIWESYLDGEIIINFYKVSGVVCVGRVVMCDSLIDEGRVTKNGKRFFICVSGRKHEQDDIIPQEKRPLLFQNSQFDDDDANKYALF